jgi:hypothetical protein
MSNYTNVHNGEDGSAFEVESQTNAEPVISQPAFAFDLSAFAKSTQESFNDAVTDVQKDSYEFAREIRTECWDIYELQASLNWVKENYKNFYFIPYFPAFHSPGWLVRYMVGPYNAEWAQTFFVDFWAGITVALTLIPQVNFVSQITFCVRNLIYLF